MDPLIRLILEDLGDMANDIEGVANDIEGVANDIEGDNVAANGETDEINDKFSQQPDPGYWDPTPAPTYQRPLNKQEKVGFAAMALVTALLCIGGYYLYSCWKRRREQRFMDYVNTRADSVLGDMVMVPIEDDDHDDNHDEDKEDGELI